jgi:hypothetical protein
MVSKNGDELDLTRVFTGFEIYEDLFSHFLTATLSLKDTNDLIVNFPIIGGEQVIISYADSVETAAIILDFVVDSIIPQSQVTNEDKKNTFLNLRLTSRDELEASKIRFSRRFNNDTLLGEPSSIINFALSAISSLQSMDNSLSTTSDDPMDFVANYWNVNELIDYVCAANTDYFFFQRPVNAFDSQYVFARLSDLVAQDPSQEFSFVSSLETRVALNSVLRFHFDRYFDLRKMNKMGGFGKTVVSPEIDEYGFTKEMQTLDGVYENYPLMGSNKPFLPSLSNSGNLIETSYNHPDAALNRNIIMQTLQNYNLVAQMNGSTLRHVGDVVSFDVPSGFSGVNNPSFHHSWLIVQIKHSLTNDGSYTQNLRLFKNGFFSNSKVG